MAPALFDLCSGAIIDGDGGLLFTCKDDSALEG
jgi:hypothetical protein